MSEVILAVNKLSKCFSGQMVIDRLSFTINQGECLAIFAPAGAGKTTLIRILSGLDTQDSGHFELFDDSPVTMFQENRLFPFMTVKENIFLPLVAQDRQITPQIQQNYQEWIDVCELGAFQDKYPYQLSGGMKQKTALIRALLQQPKFALLDEPFQSIGVKAKQTLIQHIKNACPGISLLLITHNPDEVQQLAQRVLVFEQACLTQGRQITQSNFSTWNPSAIFPAAPINPQNYSNHLPVVADDCSIK